jgi:hypothetical protein
MTFRNSLRSLAVAVCLLGIARPAVAERFNVQAKIQRPVYYRSDPNVDCRTVGAVCLRDRTMIASAQTVFVPASGQLVEVFQPAHNDLLKKGVFCGAFYTDAQGRINGSVECGAAIPNDLYLEVWGQSVRGFNVGTFNEDLFWASAIFLGASVAPVLLTAATTAGPGGEGALMTALTAAGIAPIPVLQLLQLAPDIFVWTSATRYRSSTATSFNFGTISIGGRPPATSTSTVPDGTWAAAVFEGLDFAYRALEVQVGSSVNATLPPPRSQWVVNDNLFGSPTTVWSTVHIKQSNGWSQAMRSIVHEMGHVAYNARHSSQGHYWGDVLDYMSNHYTCGTFKDARFGQYEGFATAIDDVVWANEEVGYRNLRNEPGPLSIYPSPAHDCVGSGGRRGLVNEGNVADFYEIAVEGVEDRILAPVTQGDRQGGINGEYWRLLPMRSLFEMVSQAGPDAHTAGQMWSRSLAARCAESNAGGAMFCSTERFRCHVRNHLAVPGDLPADFWQDDCLPDVSRVSDLVERGVTPTSTLVDVRLEAVPYAERYVLLLLASPGGSPLATYTVDAPIVRNVSLPACQSTYAEVWTFVENFPASSGTWTRRTGPDVLLDQPVNLLARCAPTRTVLQMQMSLP